MRRICLLFVLILSGFRAFAADNPCDAKKSLDLWIQCGLDSAQDSILAKKTQQNATKQTDSPAISTSSTSLVDHTSLADFATGALNLVGFGSSNQSSSGTTTVSAYAIYSAIRVQDPLNPGFYDAHANWRRLSFSVGTDSTTPGSKVNTTSASAIGTGASRVAGVSLLIFNGRDLSTRSNKETIKQLAANAADIARLVSRCKADILNTLVGAYEGNPAITQEVRIAWENQIEDLTSDAGKTMLRQLSQDQSTLAKIAAIFELYAGDYFAQEQAIKNAVQGMQKAAQFSISGQGSISDSKTNPSDYRAEMAFEKGLSEAFNFTANGSFDYINSAKIGADTRGGRAAIDLQYLFKSSKAATQEKKPISFDLSGEGDWFQSFKPSYVGQVKLSIPLVQGVELPFSFSYASSSNLLHEAHAVGKFGLTFDLSLIVGAITKH